MPRGGCPQNGVLLMHFTNGYARRISLSLHGKGWGKDTMLVELSWPLEGKRAVAVWDAIEPSAVLSKQTELIRSAC